MFHNLIMMLKKICPAFIWRYVHTLYVMYQSHKIKKYVKVLLGGGGAITAVEIETVNRCNGTCPFCPVNVNQPQRKFAKMSEELFRKIINELAEMNYSKSISIFSNNEPFLDERIIEFYKYANEKLPHACFCIYTNGTILTFQKFIDILQYLDLFIIDNYNDNREINTPELRKIYDYIQEHPELEGRVIFSFRLQNQILSSRGGQAPNKAGANDKSVINLVCYYPFSQLVIRPTGEVSLCCNDALGKYTMGDLNTQTISEIWNSEKYIRIREEMLKNGRKNLNLCNACDSRQGVPQEPKRKRP